MALLILGFLGLFAAGGIGATAEQSAPRTALTTTTIEPPLTTATTIVVLQGPSGAPNHLVVHFEIVPTVVGMSLAQADPVLANVGLSSEISTSSPKPGGASPTGTIVAQVPAPGTQIPRGSDLQLTVSGF